MFWRQRRCWDFKGMAVFGREESSEPKALEGQGQTTMGSLVYKTILLFRWYPGAHINVYGILHSSDVNLWLRNEGSW